ncbi:Golgi reassembly-stacking protein 2 [Neocloeon triangulifer]|uniref:Golgi reassembly-stacking protein 2 n=1 Tax=Neocloeon triangulifer TaxID=2078957 RepID=UPI00286F7D4D|nr:Golgi reassembly-stacking protein 2 [Neocloeon triangulifer]
MGGSQSVEIPGGGTEGYHVLRVQENSPGHKAGLEAFFDFILAIGSTRLDQDNDTLKELLRKSVDTEADMLVYSSKTQSVRTVKVRPSSQWGGQGLLGVSIRFCSFQGASENVWHILDVEPNSPADKAGLRSMSDYIIGADSVLHESEDLYSLLEAHEGRALSLYVYNSDDDACRQLALTPNSNWGGQGSLGCGIAFGYLHRIPIRRRQPAQVPSSPQIPDPLPPTPTIPAPAEVQVAQPIVEAPQPPLIETAKEVVEPPAAPIISQQAEPALSNAAQLAAAFGPLPTEPPPVSYAPAVAAAPMPEPVAQIPSSVPMYNMAFQGAGFGAPGGMPPPPAAIFNPYQAPVETNVPLPQPPPATAPVQPPPVNNFSLPAGMPLVTTPINLPGYPPITVSASVPLDSFSTDAPSSAAPGATTGLGRYFNTQHT